MVTSPDMHNSLIQHESSLISYLSHDIIMRHFLNTSCLFTFILLVFYNGTFAPFLGKKDGL